MNKKQQKRLRRAKLIFKHLMIKRTREVTKAFIPLKVVPLEQCGYHLALTIVRAEKGPNEPEIVPC